MCETTVFSVADGGRKQLMDNVSIVLVDGDELTLSGLLGETKKVSGKVIRVDLEKHEILIE
jgi:predicted RNA-binding protein